MAKKTLSPTEKKRLKDVSTGATKTYSKHVKAQLAKRRKVVKKEFAAQLEEQSKKIESALSMIEDEGLEKDVLAKVEKNLASAEKAVAKAAKKDKDADVESLMKEFKTAIKNAITYVKKEAKAR